ncbi:ATP-dependent nuclease [Nonomuraea sp. NPDC050022]|uniref:ATP-dependent nuclease n=1 Tax=Nonomuraea sp. NPDC050022 TaxID=3364358 RepID=UPI0037996CDD
MKIEAEVADAPLNLDKLIDGDASQFSLYIDKIVTVAGDSISLPPNGITVIVGGNNVGKSTFLQEIKVHLEWQGGAKRLDKIVDRMGLQKTGSAKDLIAWLDSHHARTVENNHEGFLDQNQTLTSMRGIINAWQTEHFSGSLHGLAGLLVHSGDAHARFQWVQPQPARSDYSAAATHPLHRLQDDENLLKAVCDLSEMIFREKLILDWLSGEVRLRVGDLTVDVPPANAITAEYRNALIALPPLHAQGDGMKSLMGLLLPIITSRYPIVIVDEPEAFLHPPQANVLGKVLGQLARDRGIQIIVATHDRNLLIGLLESQAPVSVVRLDRKADTVRAHQLDPSRVQGLWSDPVLRYTNVLDGLFHRVVVLAEADRDCRFYKASLDAAESLQRLSFNSGDVLFVPAGGKDGFVRLASVLQGVSVPLVAIPDLDLLDDESKVRKLVSSFDAEWQPHSAEYRVATNAFRQPRATVSCGQILAQIQLVLQRDPDKVYDRAISELVKSAMRAEPSPWRQLKDYGDRAFKGEAAVAANSLLDWLDGIGIVLVRAGELERLAPLVAAQKGAGWLDAAIREGAHEQEPAQDHIKRLIRSIERMLA